MSEGDEKTIWNYLGMTKQEWYDDLPVGKKCAVKCCHEKCMNKNDYLCFKHRKGFTIWKNAFVIMGIQENKHLKDKIVEANKLLDMYPENVYRGEWGTDTEYLEAWIKKLRDTLTLPNKKSEHE